MPSLFAPNFEDLFINTSYAYQVKSLKLEIPSFIATDESISVIFQELQIIRIAALSFANKGRKLCAISTDGTTCEMNSETGELLKEMKISNKLISSSVYIFLVNDKILAASNTKIRVLTLDVGENYLSFPQMLVL
ncbi:hypothetical protein Lser_V15G20848 [Lactuca serriola]